MNLKRTAPVYKISIALLLFAVLSACSRKEDRWLNRNFHALNTYYNILYHGNMAMEMGEKQIKENYVDDYWEILPVEPVFDEEDIAQGQIPDTLFPDNQPMDEYLPEDVGQDDHWTNPDPRANSLNQPAEIRNPSALPARRQDPQSLNPAGIQEQQRYQSGFGQNTNPGVNNYNQNNYNQNNYNQNNSYNQNTYNPNASYAGNQNMTGGNYQNQAYRNTGTFAPNNNANTSRQYSGFNTGAYDNSFSSGGYAANQNYRPGGGSSFAGNRQAAVFPQAVNPFLSAHGGDDFFNLAEEKATKAIQKHSMNFKGMEHNPQIKEAYLLLGKARYYDQRYFPALEAFNYVLNKYEEEQYLIAADIWREKVYMRLDNNERVVENLNYLLTNSTFVSDTTHKDTIVQYKLSKEDLTEVTGTLAQAYLNLDQKEEALQMLDIAADAARDPEKKGRYLFIKGQVLEKLDRKEEAFKAFNEVITLNRKIPRIYKINAQLKKADFFDPEQGDWQQQADTLQNLLADRENRPYQDIINYRLAELYKSLDSMPRATDYYKASLLANAVQDHKLRARIYQTLGDYNFDLQRYELAGAYYDSTMVHVPPISRQYRDLYRKRANLSEVIHYEEIVTRNDSIIRIYRMNPEERQAYFQDHVDSLKQQALAKTEAVQTKKKNRRTDKEQKAVPAGDFYFYNQQQVARGKQVFEQLWGKRELQDNWRTETGRVTLPEKEQPEIAQTDLKEEPDPLENNPVYQVETYLSQIPELQEEIDRMEEERNFARYQLGLIYMEKLKQYELAADRFEHLLRTTQDESLVLPSKYYLFKIYDELGAPQKEQYKHDLTEHYPESRYAKIAQDPEKYKQDKENPEKVYADLYRLYVSGRYREALDGLKVATDDFADDRIISKMELLKATVAGRLTGLQAYEEGLAFVARTYPQTEEGEKAEEILHNALPKMKTRVFVDGPATKHRLVYPFPKDSREPVDTLQRRLNTFIKERRSTNVAATIDVYNPETIFLVLHGFHNQYEAELFKEDLDKKLESQKEYPYLNISSANYEILLMRKNYDDYLDWQNKTK